MKKILLLSVMVVLVFASTSFAAEKYVLGKSNVALKVDWLYFDDDVFDNVDLSNGIYLGLEGYYGLTPNLYLGMEAGWATASNDKRVNFAGESVKIDVDIFYVPVELNLKYVWEVAPNWLIGFGGGVSYNWFDVDVEVGDRDADSDSWVWGGQVFADINYKMTDQWFIGINGKYQFTEDLEFRIRSEDYETNTNANNWRLGAQVGYMF